MTDQPFRFEFIQVRSLWRELPATHPQYLCDAVFDPYAGCAFGCRYCFGVTDESLAAAAPSDCRVGVKTNAPYLLRRELGESSRRGSVLVGAESDPYQPADERFQLTRQCLELLVASERPVHVLTKSRGVLRDADILGPYSHRGLLTVTVSLCSLREPLVEWLEPNAPPPSERLDLVKDLNRRGISAGVALSPLLPRLTDNPQDLKEMLRAAAAHGAAYVLPTGYSAQPSERTRKRFLEVLQAHRPELAPFYDQIARGENAEHAAWRRATWQTLSKAAEEAGIPLTLPVEGATRPDTLPDEFWTGCWEQV